MRWRLQWETVKYNIRYNILYFPFKFTSIWFSHLFTPFDEKKTIFTPSTDTKIMILYLRVMDLHFVYKVPSNIRKYTELDVGNVKPALRAARHLSAMRPRCDTQIISHCMCASCENPKRLGWWVDGVSDHNQYPSTPFWCGKVEKKRSQLDSVAWKWSSDIIFFSDYVHWDVCLIAYFPFEK